MDLSRLRLPKQAKQIKPPRQDSDPCARLLNSKVETFLSNGSKLLVVLVEVSPYAIMLENVDGVFVITAREFLAILWRRGLMVEY